MTSQKRLWNEVNHTGFTSSIDWIKDWEEKTPVMTLATAHKTSCVLVKSSQGVHLSLFLLLTRSSISKLIMINLLEFTIFTSKTGDSIRSSIYHECFTWYLRKWKYIASELWMKQPKQSHYDDIFFLESLVGIIDR